jgi:hypothetical protein
VNEFASHLHTCYQGFTPRGIPSHFEDSHNATGRDGGTFRKKKGLANNGLIPFHRMRLLMIGILGNTLPLPSYNFLAGSEN